MKASELRKAAALLKRRKLSRPSPSKLVKAAAELGTGLAETLSFIMRLKAGSQDQSGQRRELLTQIAKSGG